MSPYCRPANWPRWLRTCLPNQASVGHFEVACDESALRVLPCAGITLSLAEGATEDVEKLLPKCNAKDNAYLLRSKQRLCFET